MANSISIDQAALVIKAGGLVAFPTETVYGLGADALNPTAVAKIFEAKERPSFDPLIVHISDLSDLHVLFEEVTDDLLRLAARFWPGPLTIVMAKHSNVPDIITSGLVTVGVRMPNHPIALELISMAQTPIAAPSANKFGMLSPTEAQHVRKQLPLVDCVLDGGRTNIGVESTVIALNKDGFELLRPGAITAQEIETIVPQSLSKGDLHQLKSPGLLASHYSPRKPTYIIGETPISSDTSKAGLIAFKQAPEGSCYRQIEVLSSAGDLREAAVNLFSALHHLEDSDVDFIVVEPVVEQGVGIAIMDRLRKAAYQYKK